jgi:hypothetical protein
MFCLFQFELLMCTQTDDDEAIHVVNRFRKKYPHELDFQTTGAISAYHH